MNETFYPLMAVGGLFLLLMVVLGSYPDQRADLKCIRRNAAERSWKILFFERAYLTPYERWFRARYCLRYVDANERRIPISGMLRFVMLFIAIVGVPWYFVHSRGFLHAAKVGFGFGLFILWFVTTCLAAVIGLALELLLSR
jgi:hypothetical protein